jgi:hypothetical protein
VNQASSRIPSHTRLSCHHYHPTTAGDLAHNNVCHAVRLPTDFPCTPQAQPTGKKLSDPRKYSPEQLVGFLAALHSQRPDPRAPGKELVKPQKLLKRFLPWFTNKLQVGSEMDSRVSRQT